MNIEYLRYFLDVAQTKSITKAAKLNFISPQGMSRAMGELEKELDCKLLERFSNKLELSELGREFVPVAERVVGEYDKLSEFAQTKGSEIDPPPGEKRSITLMCQGIGALSFFPTEILTEIVTRSSVTYREADNLEIMQTLRDLAQEDRKHERAGVVALVVTFDIKRPNARQGIRSMEELGYTYKPFLRCYDMALVAANSPLAAKETLSKQNILSTPIVATNSQLYEIIIKRFGEKSVILTSAEFDLRRRLVESGSCISFMPSTSKLTAPENSGLKLVPFENAYELEIGFLGTEEDLADESVEAIVNDLTAWYHARKDDRYFTLLF